MNDRELLQAFARHKSEVAFQELVRRHAKLVYASARQRLGNAHAAEDVTQSVFLALALKAPSLPANVPLAGWLFRATRYAAADYIRREQHRREREMTAHQQQQLDAMPDPDEALALWQEISPHLPSALDQLSEADRNAVLLRFYQQSSYAAIAEALRVSPDSARKRVDRALDKLRRFFRRQGLGAGAGALAAALGAGATAEAVPAAVIEQATRLGLAGASGAIAATATPTLMLAKGALLTMTITKLKLAGGLALLGLALVAVVTVTISSRQEPSTPSAKSDQLPRQSSGPDTTARASMSVVTTNGNGSAPTATPPLAAEPHPLADGSSLILRGAHPPMMVTDAQGRRYRAVAVDELGNGAVWSVLGLADDKFALRLTQAEQIQLQRLIDDVWLGNDAYATVFDVSTDPSRPGQVEVAWKGAAFDDVYLQLRRAQAEKLLQGARRILGEERAEVLGWVTGSGQIAAVDDWLEPVGDDDKLYQFTIELWSDTPLGQSLVIRRQIGKGNAASLGNELAPWPSLGEQLGITRQEALTRLATIRQANLSDGLWRPADEPISAPVGAEDTATGKRYLYILEPAAP